MRKNQILGPALVLCIPLVALYACGGSGNTGAVDGGGGSSAVGAGGASAGSSATGKGGSAASAGSVVGKGGSSAGGGAGMSGGAAGAAGSSFGGSAGAPACTAGTILCEGTTKKVCDGKGGFSETMMCPKACAPDVGCTECVPDMGSCAGNVSTVCKKDGSGFTMETCDTDLGLTCVPATGQCNGACSKSNLERSYIGCEYFPTVTSNGQLYSGFHFAIAVANTTAIPANVKVFRGAMMVAMQAVGPNMLSTIKLPWVAELKNDYMGDAAALTSVLMKDGAYHVKSDQPVTVYQFNPLEFEIPPDAQCPDLAGTGKCNSFTNDASLLLPINVLGTSYLAASSPTLAANGGGTVQSIPGLLAITGTADGTTVTVKSSAKVRPGPGVMAMAAGGMQVFMLNTGDVIQLLTATPGANELTNCQPAGLGGPTVCVVPKTYDLTGTEITSDKAVAVIGGHDCTYIPFNSPACDHIEETIFPVNTLGTEVIVTPPQSVLGAPANDGNPDKHIVRVMSAKDGNMVTLDPLPPGASNGVLNKGQYADVPATSLDFLIKGTGPLLVEQFMLGGDFVDPNDSGTPNSKGDPSMSLGIPSAQYRKSYTFLAPDSYSFNFVNIIAPTGVTVTLDGAPVTSPAAKPIGSSGYTVTRKAIKGGPHAMTADKPFGIVVYGYGAYTSYMYPGGLNLNAL